MHSFREVIREDFERYLEGRPMTVRNACWAIYRSPGLQSVLVYRLGRALRARRGRPWWWPLLAVPALLYWISAAAIRACYDIRLHLSAEIGPGFSVLHFGGVQIVNCRLGARCSVAQQSKVGSPTDAEGPVVGDGVWIGGHAQVRGRITVGEGATIASGARVTRSVPKQALVVGDPGRVVFRAYDNSRILPRG